MAFSIFNLGKDDEHVKNQVVEVPLKDIVPNRYQPRKVFDRQAIEELAQTIREHGLLQPIIVREYEAGKYEIIAGERRFRAMTYLNWETAPAIVEKMSDEETASLALIENLQRSNLSPVEEAQAYRKLMDLNHLTQRTLAEGMGKSQSFVANKLRLLQLAEPVQTAILNHQITERHGRALLNLKQVDQAAMLAEVISHEWTVRQTEDAVAAKLGQPLPSVIRARKQREIYGIGADESADVTATTEDPKVNPKKKSTRRTNKHAPKITNAQSAAKAIQAAVDNLKGTGYHTEVTTQDTENGVQVIIQVVDQPRKRGRQS
ncbi:ParB/RepB/Spo0J family partition protein [uncultured Limosilactobacillus sp.]|mgnify:CR=1 FL=1|uniref:ParB/RepB/Spo0J family partition protein n=1 Tax=uncultured Limosilactobacillus sp. TaxID=2837629 RepID=UPI0025DE75DE|nr:ParB/RepB/Spo0J family partition protein [uncultured Limosilactobacillus sp.]